ncbi:hemicentin-2 [Nematolebias whitei]|uniref:hemicentin-2 n=1 Tax=Nematolebias whitei TaxID=451745 RepID=UPI001896FF83|nr:hemicentin-2 [Nematolebias whitei]
METTEGTLFTSGQKINPMTEWRLLLQLFMGLVLFVTGEGASCPIEFSPSKVVVKYGDPVSVNCTSTVSNLDGLGWEASQGGIGLTNVTSLTWTVESLMQWNINPFCFFSDLDGRQCQKRPELVIYSFPESISISSSSTSEMTEGNPYDLVCNILNVAPINKLIMTWYKEETVIKVEDFHLHMDGNAPKNVSIGPDIECSTIELHEGETLEDTCRVTGNPTPHVEWLKEGRLINLTVPLRRNDTGMFLVKAEGRTLQEKTIQVDVLYGPEWICPQTFTILENSNNNLACSLGFPKPEEIWFKDNEQVELPQVLTRRNAGHYQVIVSSALSVSKTIPLDINVLYPPSKIFELEDAEVDVGGNLRLKCSSVSNPKPNYYWHYYQAGNLIEETEDGVSCLIILNATELNTGFYTCQAWTEQGRNRVSSSMEDFSGARLVLFILTLLSLSNGTKSSAELECPVEISPKEVVLQYQSSWQAVQCKPKTSEENVGEIYWMTGKGTKIVNTNWFADTHRDWDPQPVCHGVFTGIGNCSKALPYTLYKTPESVSIQVMDNSRLPVEGTEVQLRCDIISVAPAQNLAVWWTFYQGNKTIEPLGNATCDFSPNSSNRSPVNVSCTMNITLERFHNGIEVRCEAELNLGPEGPQPPNMTSSALNILVLYEPKINTTKLPETVLVFRDSPEELVCEADGNPRPTIHWEYTSKTAILKSEGKLVVDDAGFYKCNATNEFKTVIQEVKVILIEDYLPLIAGFVALTVVIISIVFLFIYSIYYKNTRMRRYSFKNPKFSSQNGNVANNGWDTQLPCISSFKETVLQTTMWFFIFILIPLSGNPVSACEIKFSPPVVVVKFGGSLSATCSLSSCTNVVGMGWETTYSAGGMQSNVSSIQLNITEVKDWHPQPQCYVTFSDDQDQQLRKLPIIVYKTPTHVLFNQIHWGPMVEGQPYDLQCDVFNVIPTAYLSVRWHKGNEILSEEYNFSSYSNVTWATRLTPHRDDDGSEIWCDAIVRLLPTGLEPQPPAVQSERRKLTVKYPPTFAEPENETLEVTSDTNKTLNCKAAGNPSPSYVWRFAHSSQEKMLNQIGNGSVLDQEVLLSGIYSCTASNDLGQTTKYITVTEAKGDRTTFAAILGGFLCLGVALFIAGFVFAQPNGKFSFPKGHCVSGEGCSLVLKPSRVVVGFGESVSVVCEATRPVRVLGWESALSAPQTHEDRSVQWKVDSLIDWIEEPICYGVFFTAPRQCEEKLNLVLYKTPDSVSIRPVNNTGPMVEGKEYQLLCEVQNIAPVQFLTLRWYRGQTEVYKHSFSDLTSSSPVQVSSTLVITPTKAENDAEYKCVAELELGPEGPQPPPAVASEPLTASVYCSPTFFNPETEVLEVTHGEEITLNCTAAGNPAPVYSWQSSHLIQEKMKEEAVIISSSLLPGTYTCTVSNMLEKKSKQFIVKAKIKAV